MVWRGKPKAGGRGAQAMPLQARSVMPGVGECQWGGWNIMVVGGDVSMSCRAGFEDVVHHCRF